MRGQGQMGVRYKDSVSGYIVSGEYGGISEEKKKVIV